MLISSSPNWYSSSVIGAVDDERVVFCSRQSLFCYRITKENGIDRGFGIKAFQSKCTVCSTGVANGGVVVAGSDSGEIKVFRVDTDHFEQESQYHEHQTSVTALDATDRVIVSGDAKSTLCIRRIESSETNKVRHGDQHNEVKAITINEDGLLAAIGYEKGIIYVINLTDQSTVGRLRGHDGDIQSIIFINKYLVTASKDKTIRLWRRGDGFKCAKMLKLPKASGYKGKRQQEHDAARVWTTLTSTSSQNNFISSGQGGDIISWHINDDSQDDATKEIEVKPTIFCENQTDLTHQRVVFGLTHLNSLLVSTSMDRVIKVWCLDANRPLFSLVTNGGFVYAINVKPDDPLAIAYGVGDGMFRVWQRDTQPGPEQLTVWQGVKEKVTALAWSVDGDQMAFGTELGKVGKWTVKSNKVANSSQFHKKTVYALCWFNGQLISCGGDSAVYVHSFNEESDKLVKLTIENKSSFSTIATDNNNYLCGGDDNGQVFLFNGTDVHNLKLVDCNMDSHTKYVTCIAFSKNYLATCSNSGSVVIAQGRSSLTPYRRLGGHTERVNAACFSPDEGQLVTASMDGTCQVWCVQSGNAIANYDGHTDSHVYCVAWSGDKQIVSGADDYVLRSWSIADCTCKVPPEKKTVKSSQKRKQKPKQTMKVPKVKTPEVTKEETKKEIVQEAVVRSKKAFGEMNKADLEQPLDDIVTVYKGMQNCIVTDQLPDHLVHLIESDQAKSKLKQIVKSEIESLITSGSTPAAIELSTWLNSTISIVNDVKLNDMIVALSASAGHSVWRQVVKCYIEQLVAETNFTKAAAYQVTLGDVSKAIGMLCDGRHYRDALILARLNGLPCGDILTKWADRMALGGNLGQAAKCHIARGEVEEALTLLKRRNDLSHLFCAVHLSVMAGFDTTQLIDQLLTPVVSFGRWGEFITFLNSRANDHDEIGEQVKLYVYFHWKLSIGYGREVAETMPPFSSNSTFKMDKPTLPKKKPTLELFASQTCIDLGLC